MSTADITPTLPSSTNASVDPRLPRTGRRVDGAAHVVRIGDVPFGAEPFVVIAGPCAVESPEMIERAAADVASLGASVLRGGAFKPRTSPYSFQGMGMPGIEIG